MKNFGVLWKLGIILGEKMIRKYCIIIYFMLGMGSYYTGLLFAGSVCS